MARTRLLAFHWALASHVVRVAVVRLQLPPWFRVGVHCGRGGQWRAMVCLYMHLKVGRGGETWDQRNKEQGSCLTNSGFEREWCGFACRNATRDCLSGLRLELRWLVSTSEESWTMFILTYQLLSKDLICSDKDENLNSQNKLMMKSQSEDVLSQWPCRLTTAHWFNVIPAL